MSEHSVNRVRDRRLTRRRMLTLSATFGLGAAGLALVGCGDDDDSEPAAAQTPAATDEPQAAEPTTPVEEQQPEPQTKPKRQRGGQRSKKATADASPSRVTARPPLTTTRARTPVTGAPTEDVPAPFAHPAEYEFARILDFYGITWQYEPRSFPLRWEHDHVVEAFTPDFYLPDLDMYVEITTLKTGLTADKNRKMRLLKQLHPEVNIKLLKKRDYLRLLAKYGYGPWPRNRYPK